MTSDLLKIFLDTLAAENGSAKNTLVSYKYDLEQFFVFFEKKNISDISRQDLKNYIVTLNSRGYSAKSILRKISSLRDFFKFLITENIISENPAVNLETPKKEKNLPDFLTQKEIFKLIKVAADSDKFIFRRNGAMISLMYASGLRVSELVSLKISAINFKKALVFVKGKGNKERLIPIAAEALDYLYNYIDERECFLKNKKSDYLFPSAKTPSLPLTRDVFFRQLKELALCAGINQEKIHPHVLRHSFATFLINHNTGLRSVQKMLGHENITTTEIYTHVLSDNLKNMVNKHHPLAKIKKNNN